jgi:hypothetical protein
MDDGWGAARGQARDPAVTVTEPLIELDVARFLPGSLGRLGRPLVRLLRPVVVLLLRLVSQEQALGI